LLFGAQNAANGYSSATKGDNKGAVEKEICKSNMISTCLQLKFKLVYIKHIAVLPHFQQLTKLQLMLLLKENLL
jgi:hypothetical protein